jgi:pyruvate/2-oxoglutarate/acetoin dehydrogenase E1 component
MRGFRPIAEIQYLDYLLYGLQILSDDLATLQYRSFGGQKAPVIIRTRGHRLEGVWHSGSPMSTIISSLRGIYVCTPRNMVQAAGMYNTLLQGDEPGMVIECLNGYRKKEKMPNNLDTFTLPLGKVEVIKEGTDITIVTYGSMCSICTDAADKLVEYGILAEVIDVQTLLPFDLNHDIVKSLAKTNRVLFADEDVPGGASAYMMQKVLEEQNGYIYLDAKPKTIHSWAHRPAYATDGDYFSKPNIDDVVEYVYKMFAEDNPQKFPPMYW